MTEPRRRAPIIGLVVPSLESGGGIPTVADFVCDTIEGSRALHLQIVSLATAKRDTLSLSFTRPTSWLRGVATSETTWRGRPVTRIGAFASEFEFQRYQPRLALTKALSRCDLIQVVSGSPATAWAVRGLGKPVAVLCATRAVVERRLQAAMTPLDAWRRLMTMVTDRIDRQALRTVDAIQVMNPWMFDYARTTVAERPTLVRFLPPGVDTDRFFPLERRSRADPYVLCVGRLNDERKNVSLLLRAFHALPSGLKSATRLVLAGTALPGPLFWRLVEALGLRHRVSFVASPDSQQLVSLYQTARVFALTSDEEGFGMVLIEAMACGVPVVSTRCGGPDGIIRDGHDGYLVEVGDVAGFSDRLKRLLSDEEQNKRMGNAARATVLERFNRRVTGTALLDTYDALLARQPAHHG